MWIGRLAAAGEGQTGSQGLRTASPGSSPSRASCQPRTRWSADECALRGDRRWHRPSSLIHVSMTHIGRPPNVALNGGLRPCRTIWESPSLSPCRKVSSRVPWPGPRNRSGSTPSSTQPVGDGAIGHDRAAADGELAVASGQGEVPFQSVAPTEGLSVEGQGALRNDPSISGPKSDQACRESLLGGYLRSPARIVPADQARFAITTFDRLLFVPPWDRVWGRGNTDGITPSATALPVTELQTARMASQTRGQAVLNAPDTIRNTPSSNPVREWTHA